MSLSVTAQSSKPQTQREIAKKGPRPAILSGIIDIGIQAQEFQGEVKAPCREFVPVFTLCSDKYTTDEGEERCMVTSPWPVKIKLGEKSNYTKFTKALDPNGEVMEDGVGNLTDLIGRKCFVNMVHSAPNSQGIVYANMKGAPTELPDDYPIPETDYNVCVFDCENPDPEVWEGLWDNTKNRIRAGVNYNEEEFMAKMEEYEAPAETTGGTAAVDDDDDIPF